MIVKWKKAGHHLGRLSFQSNGLYRRSRKASARMGQSAVKMQLDSKAPAVVEMTLYEWMCGGDRWNARYRLPRGARSTKHEAQSRSEAVSQVRMLVDGRPDDNLVSMSTSKGK
jgi:hypothetical protein